MKAVYTGETVLRVAVPLSDIKENFPSNQIICRPDDHSRTLLRLRFVLIWLCFCIVGVPVYAATTNEVDSKTIAADVDRFLNARGKVSWEPIVERIVSFGDRVVPILSNRLAKATEGESAPYYTVVSLCKIDTDASLKPIHEILLNSSRDRELLTANQFPRESEISFWCQKLTAAIRNYPTNRETEVLQCLIRLSDPAFEGMVGYYATERLREMIRRQPSVAGVIISSLDDNREREQFSWNLGDILAMESGHQNRWGVFGGPSNPQTIVALRNSIWRDWWTRNRDKSIAEWRAEARVISATIPITYSTTNSAGGK